MSDNIFTFQGYNNFLKNLKNIGEFSLFRDWNGTNKFLLRHDIDLDLHKSLKLAKIENGLGIKSTYFVMVSSENYNINSYKNRAILNEIQDLKHEIGLHFDPTIYNEEKLETLEKYVDFEIEIISKIISLKPKSISLHNPSVHGSYLMFKNYINAYDGSIFNDEIYISDSRMKFRNKNIYTFVKKIKNSPIQILLHPMHYSKNGDSYPLLMKSRIDKIINNIHSEFEVNSTYKSQVGDSLKDCYLNVSR